MKKAILNIIGGIFYALILFLYGVVLKALWGWYMTPTFGLPAISLAQAIGIILIISLLTTSQYTGQDDMDVEAHIHEAIYMIAYPLLILLFGWIVHFYA